MGKIEDIEKRQAELEHKLLMESQQGKAKPFKLPGRVNRVVNSGMKAGDSIVTQYLTQKGEIKFKTQKIISGNIIVVNNKAHSINPKHLWRCGKQTWYIHREIDRNPVSNEDYEEVKARGDDTDSDVVLIKAVLGAMMKPKTEIKKGWIIWIVVAVVVGVVGFILLKGGGTTPPVETAPALAGLFIPKKWRKKWLSL